LTVSQALASQGFEPGCVLAGKYRIERKLGAGGMGMVFEATHLMLAERVAIKVLLPQDGDGQSSRSRFFREAQAAARINSLHVCKVRDIGELEAGEPFIVMDYLEGFNLDAWIKEHGALDVERAVQWMLDACKGLAAAHAAGVIHRDIKAANLFMASTADGGSVLKILDFGISKLTEAQGMAGAPLTGTNASMGSPLTMSPEQMLSPREVDPRTDIWSLGTVLYRCLSGAQPFEAESLPQLCVLVMEAQTIPLQTRRPDLPAALVDIVARCLRKVPEERFRDVTELAQALAPFAGEGGAAAAEQCRRLLRLPVTADASPSSAQAASPAVAPSGAQVRASSWLRRIALAAVLVLAVGLTITLLALRPDGRPPESTRSAAREQGSGTLGAAKSGAGAETPASLAPMGAPSLADAGLPAHLAPGPSPASQPATRAPASKRPARQPGKVVAPPLDPFGQRK
jgi:eukaryotic-like serine/threonine-protein kinase